MPVRVFWVYEGEAVAWGFELAMALSYAADNGARVINLSAGGPYSHAIDEAVRLHPEALLVTAAGNAGADLADSENYPCELPYENVLCVAASDRGDSLASFSNHGTGADIAAPGVDVLSSYLARVTLFEDDFEHGLGKWDYNTGWATTQAQATSGTHSAAASFSSPHFSGVSATLMTPRLDLRGRYSCRLRPASKESRGPIGRRDRPTTSSPGERSRSALPDMESLIQLPDRRGRGTPKRDTGRPPRSARYRMCLEAKGDPARRDPRSR